MLSQLSNYYLYNKFNIYIGFLINFGKIKIDIT